MISLLKNLKNYFGFEARLNNQRKLRGFFKPLLETMEDRIVPAAGFFQGFELDTVGWTGAARVSSGTNAVPSATGDFHAEAIGNMPFTYFGSPTTAFPTGGYTTSIDIYLNMSGGAANNTSFDWDSAINNSAGGHRRDFIFNAGFYNDTDVTGSGDRFVISASNNSSPGSAFPKNLAKAPFTITNTGWYTFQHHFYDSGSGVLAVDMTIKNATGATLNTWTLSDPTDIIGSTVGGNRYGWFSDQDFAFLAFDNSYQSVSVEAADFDVNINQDALNLNKQGAINVTFSLADTTDDSLDTAAILTYLAGLDADSFRLGSGETWSYATSVTQDDGTFALSFLSNIEWADEFDVPATNANTSDSILHLEVLVDGVWVELGDDAVRLFLAGKK